MLRALVDVPAEPLARHVGGGCDPVQVVADERVGGLEERMGKKKGDQEARRDENHKDRATIRAE